MGKQIEMYNGKVFGKEVSSYGLEKGYLDYQTLGQIVGDAIFNGTVRYRTAEDWEVVAGDGDQEVMSDYMISKQGYNFLAEYTDELVFYNEHLDIYIWGVCHWGTAWSHVLTNVKLVEGKY